MWIENNLNFSVNPPRWAKQAGSSSAAWRGASIWSSADDGVHLTTEAYRELAAAVMAEAGLDFDTGEGWWQARQKAAAWRRASIWSSADDGVHLTTETYRELAATVMAEACLDFDTGGGWWQACQKASRAWQRGHRAALAAWAVTPGWGVRNRKLVNRKKGSGPRGAPICTGGRSRARRGRTSWGEPAGLTKVQASFPNAAARYSTCSRGKVAGGEKWLI